MLFKEVSSISVQLTDKVQEKKEQNQSVKKKITFVIKKYDFNKRFLKKPLRVLKPTLSFSKANMIQHKH